LSSGRAAAVDASPHVPRGVRPLRPCHLASQRRPPAPCGRADQGVAGSALGGRTGGAALRAPSAPPSAAS
jgi:hypothetical protein